MGGLKFGNFKYVNRESTSTYVLIVLYCGNFPNQDSSDVGVIWSSPGAPKQSNTLLVQLSVIFIDLRQFSQEDVAEAATRLRQRQWVEKGRSRSKARL